MVGADGRKLLNFNPFGLPKTGIFLRVSKLIPPSPSKKTKITKVVKPVFLLISRVN